MESCTIIVILTRSCDHVLFGLLSMYSLEGATALERVPTPLPRVVTGDAGCVVKPAFIMRKPWIQDFYHGSYFPGLCLKRESYFVLQQCFCTCYLPRFKFFHCFPCYFVDQVVVLWRIFIAALLLRTYSFFSFVCRQ